MPSEQPKYRIYGYLKNDHSQKGTPMRGDDDKPLEFNTESEAHVYLIDRLQRRRSWMHQQFTWQVEPVTVAQTDDSNILDLS